MPYYTRLYPIIEAIIDNPKYRNYGANALAEHIASITTHDKRYILAGIKEWADKQNSKLRSDKVDYNPHKNEALKYKCLYESERCLAREYEAEVKKLKYKLTTIEDILQRMEAYIKGALS